MGYDTISDMQSIIAVIEAAGPTQTHDVYGDRRRANTALKRAADIARAAEASLTTARADGIEEAAKVADAVAAEDKAHWKAAGRDQEAKSHYLWAYQAGETIAAAIRALSPTSSRADGIEVERLREALRSAVKIADEAAEEWDKAPSGMRAGKILLALAGHVPGYRRDTDAIHAALSPPANEPAKDETEVRG